MAKAVSTKKPYSVVREVNAPAVMRDGTTLMGDVYRPDAQGRFPTIVTRTAYDKSRTDIKYYDERGYRLAERGYVYVVQDIRGTHASEGEFRPCAFRADHFDPEDGYDTIEWAAALPWSDGKVGTVGSSYDGWTQWALAHTRPPHLVAMMPQAIDASTRDQELGGVFRLRQWLYWAIGTLAPDQRARDKVHWGAKTGAESKSQWIERDLYKWLWYLPLMEIPDDVMYGIGPNWRNKLAHLNQDMFGFLEKHRDIEVPALITTGWFDQQNPAIKNFTGMMENGRTETARNETRLIVGPWKHTGDEWDRHTGQVDFGPEAERSFYDTVDHWFSHWLKGENSGVAEWPRAQIFVMGANRWRAEDRWPLAGTRYVDYFLHGGGCANTPAGDGLLSEQPPGESAPDSYTYDPRDPVMSLFPTPTSGLVPMDQRPLDGRQDILVYSTPPLEEAVEVVGDITVKLWAASSARDTDFTVKLIDVYPDGFALMLCYGILRARYRDGLDSPSLIEPGKPYEFTIRVNATGNLFKPGHRIRVDISSSDFPNFDRNHNTGGDDYAESTLVTAHQTVFHDQARPSRIVLPVVS